MLDIIGVLTIGVMVIAVAYFSYRRYAEPNASTNPRGSLNSLNRHIIGIEKRATALIREREALCTMIRDIQARLDTLREELECGD